MAPKKSVYIVYTGGTIGMKKNSGGAFGPERGYLESLMAQNPLFRSSDLPRYRINEYSPLLDSSNMRPENWMRIARDIKEQYHRYDGFIVLHGTDTMAYTASALPFMLPGLQKPVVVTGSQVPLCETRTDAVGNLITSLLLASGAYSITEVVLCFGSKILRGCRASKLYGESFEAFDSPNFPALGTVGIDIKVNTQLMRPGSQGHTYELRLQPMGEPVVAALRLFPGISARVLTNILKSPLKGLVLEAYGAGNGPDRDGEILEVIGEACERGVVIIACTQCLTGTVNLSLYQTGSALAQAGVISGLDMTSEAALAKLYSLFSRLGDPGEIRELMQQDLHGELTPLRH